MKVVNIDMEKEMADELERRAASMSLSAGKYAEQILSEWLESGERLDPGEN